MVYILSGGVGAGTTTFLNALAAELYRKGVPFDGYLSERVLSGDEVQGYDLADLQTGDRRPFLRREGEAGAQRVGAFIVLPDGLAAAENVLRRSAPGPILIVDELGPLELGGAGVWPAGRGPLLDLDRKSVVAVREGLVDAFVGVFGEVPTRIVRLSAADPGSFAAEVVG
jgi:nucleoside-triphosphatase THEP1